MTLKFLPVMFSLKRNLKIGNIAFVLSEKIMCPVSILQACEPLMIYSEYRFWVVKHEIVTKSMYIHLK